MNEQTKINWYRCKIDKAVMSGLMRKDDARAFIQAVGQLALFAATGVLSYLAWLHLNASNWPTALPLLLLALFAHGTNGTFLGGTACHELSHKTPFANQFWNTFFLRIYAFISWFDPVGYRASHIRHHQATTHHDLDGEVVLPTGLDMHGIKFIVTAFTFSPEWVWKVFRFWMAAASGNFSRDGFFRADWLQRVADTKTRNEIRNWARILFIGHLALAALFIVTGNWFLIVIVSFGSFYAPWLGILTGAPQHAGLSPDTPDFRLCCRTYTCSWLPAFFYWNMQYHVEHHMFPAVPFYNLPRLRKAIEHDLPPAPHGLWATWREMLPILRRQRSEPTYFHTPPVPQNEGSRVDDELILSEAAQV